MNVMYALTPSMRRDLILICSLTLAGCDSKPAAPAPVPVAVTPPDRLEVHESPPGAERVFGIELPRGLRVLAHFGKEATLAGPMSLADVVAFLSRHVESTPIEFRGTSAVFPRVRVNGDTQRRDYRIEVVRQERTTRVQFVDVTPPPVTHGLDEKQRWEQAGRGADGSPLDPRKMY
jgi:hypothetical protein